MSDAEQQRAREALATIEAHQQRVRRAARVPWWAYLAMFLIIAVGTAVNDVVGMDGAKVLSGAVLVLAVTVPAVTVLRRTGALSRFRGVQARQRPEPRALVAVAVLAAVGLWAASRFGDRAVDAVARAVGLRDYPNTVAGVLFGAGFTLVFAVGRVLVEVLGRRDEA